MNAADLVSLASALAALMGAGVLAFKWTMERYNRTLGSRHHLQDRIDLLSCGVTIEYIDRILGPPAMQWEGPAQTTQRAYWAKHAWVSVLASEGGFVGALSVTVTDPKFRFSLVNFTNGSLDMELGKSRFSDAPMPAGWRFYQGGHNYEYVESHYAGNPTFYQTFFLGSSDAGTGSLNLQPLFFADVPTACGYAFEEGDAEPPDVPAMKTFRTAERPNTFAVLCPDLPSGLARAWKPVGVHYERVRMFPMHPTEYRQSTQRGLAVRRRRAAPTESRRLKEASAGDTNAMLALGGQFEARGDMENAEKWYRKAVSTGGEGSPNAAHFLGELHLAREELIEAEAWFRKAAELGFLPMASWAVADLLRKREDYRALEDWFRKGAVAGRSDDMRELGNLLWERGDDAEAETWLRKAADKNDDRAMWSLGNLLWKRGDDAEAETWLRKAADNVIWAYVDLGELLWEQERNAEAEIWLRKAVDNEEIRAMYLLGQLLWERGDEAEAETWLRRAGAAGDAHAEATLRRLLHARAAETEDESPRSNAVDLDDRD